MTRRYIAELKTLHGDQQEIVIEVNEQGGVARIDADGNIVHDIAIIPPATHDMIDIIASSTKATSFIRSSYNFLETRPMGQSHRPPMLGVVYNGDKDLPIGEIQVMDKPVIDAAIIQLDHTFSENLQTHLYEGIHCVGYINFIDAR